MRHQRGHCLYLLSEVKMQRDVVELMEEYLTEDQTKWGKLASDIHWRRLQLLLLREILVELRELKQDLSRNRVTRE